MALGDLFMAEDTDSECGDGKPAEAAVGQERKNWERTKKARNASLVARALKKREGAQRCDVDDGIPSVAKDLQKKFLTGRIHHAYALLKSYDVKPGAANANPTRAIQRGRARCAWSLLCLLAQVLESVFSVSQTPPVRHVINTIVADDTNTRLKTTGDTRSRAIVFTVMNQVQNCVVEYERPLPSKHSYKCLAIPCPTIALKSAHAGNIHAAYTSYAVAGASGVGCQLQRLELSPEIFNGLGSARWVLQVMCGDALKANNAMFQMQREHLAKEKKRDPKQNRVAIRFKCSNHQLGLVRRPAVLAVKGFWSCLVRLAHLFECSSFRRRFTTSLLAVLQKPEVFQRLREIYN